MSRVWASTALGCTTVGPGIRSQRPFDRRGSVVVLVGIVNCVSFVEIQVFAGNVIEVRCAGSA
jgi:hypothetical protein